MFENIMLALESANKSADIAIMKSDSYAKMAYMEAAINMEEAEYKVMTESGTEDDMMVLFEEAKDGFVGKIKTAINNIIEALKEFFRKIRNKITSLFSKGDAERKMQEIDKKIKRNPFIRKKKVEIPDSAQEKRVIKEHMEKVKKFIYRLRSGDKVSETEIAEEKESFIRKHAKAVAATTTIAVLGLSALTYKLMKGSNKEIDESEKYVIQIIDNAANSVGDMTDSESAMLMQKCSNDMATTSKMYTNCIVGEPVKLLGTLKGAVGSGTEIDGDDIIDIPDSDVKPMDESATAFDFFGKDFGPTYEYSYEDSSDMFSEFDDMFNF